MDYDNIINELIASFDLSNEVAKKQAFRKCIEYSESKLSDDIHCNEFLDIAARRLKQTKVMKNIVKYLVDEASKNSKLHLTYTDANGPCLTGNSDGLKYLSQILANLSKTNLNGEHVHLYDDEFPMFGDTYSLTIYFEDDAWFEKHAISEEDDSEEGQDEGEYIQERNLDIKSMIGFMPIAEPPPIMPIIAKKIYKILSFEPYRDQKVWSKNIRESKDRMYVFSFINDDGKQDQFAFDIDDTAITLFDNEEYFGQISSKNS